MRAIQAETNDGRKWFVEMNNGEILPQAEVFEVGGYRVILPNSDTKFVFYSETVRNFCE